MKRLNFALILLLISISGISQTKNFIDQTDKSGEKQTINVTGYSEVKVKPDIALISLYISSKSENKSNALNVLNSTIDSTLNQIKLKNVKNNKLIIDNLDIYRDYYYTINHERKNEYSASQSIDMELSYDISEIEKLIEIIKDVPNLNFYINFDISKTKKDSILNDLAKSAIQNGSEKAKLLAKSANLEIVKILDISYHADRYGAINYDRGTDDIAAPSNTAKKINLSPRDIDLNDQVQMTFLVRNRK